MTLPTPHRRAELRGLPGRDTLTDAELTALLDATEPTQDAEVAECVGELRENHQACMEGSYVQLDTLFADAASLLTRLARELVEARAILHPPRGPIVAPYGTKADGTPMDLGDCT